MLPIDVKACIAAATGQLSLNAHVDILEPVDRSTIVTYLDELFQELAEDWMIATNQVSKFLFGLDSLLTLVYIHSQPLNALSNKHFRKMVEVAARTKQGVQVPNTQATCAHILEQHQITIVKAKELLNSDRVPSKISTTCDVWLFCNCQGWYAVTSHWVEETKAGIWKLCGALLGFTQLNMSRTGKNLAQAHYAILK